MLAIVLGLPAFAAWMIHQEVGKLAEFLAERCEEWGIRCVDDAEASLNQLAELSGCVPGLALQVLRRAHKNPGKLLTMEMIEEHVFKIEELN
ncbi:MAG: hypothetical protein H0T51_25745 [Pirellulales bacterium]|nr:hypothetical protein [Pirellulales bacterium]